MGISQAKSKRSPTGKRLNDYRKKKQFETGKLPVLTKIGQTKKKITRTIGGNSKEMLLNAEFVNVLDPKNKTSSKTKLLNVLENEANRNFIRRNILTKGTIVKTEKGKVKITNRPGQEGTVNGILVE
ncbi:MAG: 30S ribosomal protein S8e [Candidatus Woesearchaeota archaeon]